MTVDWQRLLLNLKSCGVSYNAVATRTGMDPQTVGRLVRQEIREPKFSSGLALLDLHFAMCPDKHQGLKQ